MAIMLAHRVSKNLGAGVLKVKEGRIRTLSFEGSPKTLHRGVIQALSLATDANVKLMPVQQRCVLLTGILTLLVGMMAQARGGFSQCHV